MPEKQKAGSGQAAGSQNDIAVKLSQPQHSINGAGSIEPSFEAELAGNFHSSAELAAESLAERAEAALLLEGVHDEGNAQCTHLRYSGAFVYTEALGWLHYTGTHWSAEGAEAAVDRAIVDTLTARASAALRSGQAEQHEKLIKFCIPNKQRVQGAKYLLQSLVAASATDFDRAPDLLNCKNGVLNLRTGELVPHSAEQRFTYCVTVAYKPEASSEVWQKWLLDTVNSELIADWLQLAVGYSLTGHTSEEILFYLYGPPRAGKGLFTETLIALLGSPLAKEADFNTFTEKRTGDSQNFDLAPLKASRLIAASESNSYQRLNEAVVKRVTGGNYVRCAFKHRDHFEFQPQFKIWLSSNQPVNADPDDPAVWGRLRLIEFPNSHLGKENKQLKARMRSEPVLEGLLAWAVAGAVKWYALGAAGLPELESSATLKAQQREELDNVAAWLSEATTAAPAGFTGNARIYPNYAAWCKENGVAPKSQKGLTQALQHKGYTVARQRFNGKVVRGFKGFSVDG